MIKIHLKQDAPGYTRLTKGIVVAAKPVDGHPELMRVEEVETLLNEGQPQHRKIRHPEQRLRREPAVVLR